MKKLLLFLILICTPLHAEEGLEVIAGFEKESDLPVLNNELRKINTSITNLQTNTVTIGHTYAIAGEIKVPVSDVDFICPFFVAQAGSIVNAKYKINSGTSVTAKLQNNGADVSGYTGISVTGTAASTTGTVEVAAGDKLALVVTAVSGTPKNLSFTIAIQYA